MKKTLLLTTFLLPLSIFGLSGRSDDAAGKTSPKRINARTAKEIMESGEKIVLLDVRTREEYIGGHIKGALNLPYDQIPQKATAILQEKSTKILVYCASGARSAAGSRSLVSLGYTDVSDFGGIMSWPYEVVR